MLGPWRANSATAVLSGSVCYVLLVSHTYISYLPWKKNMVMTDVCMYVCMYGDIIAHKGININRFSTPFSRPFFTVWRQRSLGLTFATSNTYLYAVCLSHSPFGFWKTWLRCRHLPTPGCRASDWSDPPTLLTDTASLLLLIILSQRQDNFLPSL